MSDESPKKEAAHVYQAVTTIMAIMAREGIAKSRKNEQQGYTFRGIDEVYAALSEHVAAERLCIFPRVVDRSVTERATRSGGVSTYVVLTVEFDLVSAVDGSQHMIRTMGEAMDSADKATNKGMSAAMKYACLMVFMIPTAGSGGNDADYKHPEKAAPRNGARPSAASSSSVQPRGPVAAVPQSPANDELWLEWALNYTVQMKAARSAGELKAVFATAWREAEHRNAPPAIRASLEKAKNDLKTQFGTERAAS